MSAQEQSRIEELRRYTDLDMVESAELFSILDTRQKRIEMLDKKIEYLENRYLPCPDCRDKVTAGECLRCKYQKRIEEMRRLMIILLKSKDCYHDSTGAEIAEEISAQFDIGLHDAYRICEALQ